MNGTELFAADSNQVESEWGVGGRMCTRLLLLLLLWSAVFVGALFLPLVVVCCVVRGCFVSLWTSKCLMCVCVCVCVCVRACVCACVMRIKPYILLVNCSLKGHACEMHNTTLPLWEQNALQYRCSTVCGWFVFFLRFFTFHWLPNLMQMKSTKPSSMWLMSHGCISETLLCLWII